jgi:hypothetical protein
LPPEQADRSDVDRLQAIMRRLPEHADMAADLPQPFPAPAALHDERPPLEAGDTVQIGAEIERLWVGDGTSGVRQVRVRLRRELLPDTSVRLFEEGGRLHVDMTVGSEPTCRWLSAQLPSLGAGLGERLGRPLRLVVRGVRAAAGGMTVFNWPEEVSR